MEHDMDPPIDPPRDVIWSAGNHERCYTLGDKWFVKRQLYGEELPVSRDGRLIYPIWDSERLRNECLATRFIRVHTDIPVQDCRLFLENGLMCFASRQASSRSRWKMSGQHSGSRPWPLSSGRWSASYCRNFGSTAAATSAASAARFRYFRPSASTEKTAATGHRCHRWQTHLCSATTTSRARISG